MARRGGRATINWVSEEPLGFVPMPVEFRISGSVSSYTPGDYMNPPEGGEVEIDEVIRIDPFTKEETDITAEDWPFHDKELEEIEGLLFDNVANYGFDEPDFDDDL